MAALVRVIVASAISHLVFGAESLQSYQAQSSRSNWYKDRMHKPYDQYPGHNVPGESGSLPQQWPEYKTDGRYGYGNHQVYPEQHHSERNRALNRDFERNRQAGNFPGREITSSAEAWERGASGPTFDSTPQRNITALKDSIAYLHCIVNNLGNWTLSWIREKDLHILTVGKVTYTADDRFEVIHKDGSNSWTLKINSVQPRDTGRYECQVNNHPTDPITFPIYLAVFVPTAHIVGSTERYVDRGSTINLTCIINHNPDPPSATFWYHNNKVINYDSRGSRVSVITDRGTSTKTILLIHDASAAASGTYSCAPSPTTAASVRIHILNAGETPAAMQTNDADSVRLQDKSITPVAALTVLLALSSCTTTPLSLMFYLTLLSDLLSVYFQCIRRINGAAHAMQQSDGQKQALLLCKNKHSNMTGLCR